MFKNLLQQVALVTNWFARAAGLFLKDPILRYAWGGLFFGVLIGVSSLAVFKSPVALDPFFRIWATHSNWTNSGS